MEKYIDEHLDEMIEDLRKLVKFNSINNDDAVPFGKENRDVLDTALSLLEKKGFKTNNLDYYCGYGEVGEGDKVIGIVSHLDIVPSGDGWNSNPFELMIKDGVMYGRGVSDNKGASVCSMWALKYLLDTGYKFKKRVRIIYGCNEESGSQCIRHYVEKEGNVDYGFTPDSTFPGVFAEKGIIGGSFVGRNTKIIDIKGGDAVNIVCKSCECVLPLNSFSKEKLDAFFKKHNIKYSLTESDNIKLTVYGKAAHAATPDEGVNAINYLLVGLKESDFEDSFVDFFYKNIGLTLHGEKLGYDNLKDDMSNTSINIGLAFKHGNDIYTTVDMRFPVKQNIETCVKPLMDTKDDNNEFIERSSREPLYFDINSPFIKALDKAYRTVTNDFESKMQAIGGGTYAKEMKNVIAFGCEFENETNNIHGANEALTIESFKKQTMCYIEAIKNLNEV